MFCVSFFFPPVPVVCLPTLPMGPTFSVRGVLAEKRKGKPALSDDPLLDEPLWELAEVLWEIARNGPTTEAGRRESPTVNTEESAKDEQSSA